MKDYNVTWWKAETYPELNREWLGLIPEFFISATTEAGDGDLEQVCNAMDEVYMYGGFRYLSAERWTMKASTERQRIHH